MPKQLPIEIFMPPNILKAKVGSGVPGLDAAAVKRAEAAIAELKEEFSGWMAEDVTRLSKARDAFAGSRSQANYGALYRAAHDLKGQGATFDFPMVARIAASICRLTDGTADPNALPLSLVDAHVDAIKVAVRDNIRDVGDGTAAAAALAQELEFQVAQIAGPEAA
jgi:chemotaxis protein histidine kinase CheA